MKSDRQEDCRRIVRSAISEANTSFRFEQVFQIAEAGIVLLGQLDLLDRAADEDHGDEDCDSQMGFNTLT